MFQIIYKHYKISQPYWMIYIILNYLLNVGVNKLYLLKDKHQHSAIYQPLFVLLCFINNTLYEYSLMQQNQDEKHMLQTKILHRVCYDNDLTTWKLNSRAPYITCLHTACTCRLMVKSEQDWIKGQQIMVQNCTSKIFATV